MEWTIVIISKFEIRTIKRMINLLLITVLFYQWKITYLRIWVARQYSDNIPHKMFFSRKMNKNAIVLCVWISRLWFQTVAFLWMGHYQIALWWILNVVYEHEHGCTHHIHFTKYVYALLVCWKRLKLVQHINFFSISMKWLRVCVYAELSKGQMHRASCIAINIDNIVSSLVVVHAQ